MSQVLEDLVDFYAPQAQLQRVQLRVRHGDGPIKSMLDEKLIKQAILNLLYRKGAAWNEGKFNSNALDKLIDAGAATVDPIKQRNIFRKALNMVATQSGVGISFHVNGTHVAKKIVQGVVVDPQIMLILDRAWLG